MRRLHLGFLAFGLPVLVLSLVLAGCGSKTEGDKSASGDKTEKKAKGKGKGKSALQPVAAKEFGTLKGKIVWAGAKPNLEELTSALQNEMKSKKEDADYCLHGKPDKKPSPDEVSEYVYKIGKNNNLGNVFVWLQPEDGSFFDIPKDQLEGIKDVTLHQPHCGFVPHCIVLFPSYRVDAKTIKQSGQKLVVKNDAEITHNTKIKGGARNPEKDETMAKHTEKTYVLNPEKDPVTISCGIHPWMRGYARVFDHPYAAVSLVSDGDDHGTYEIKNVPASVKVRLFAWHEKAGYLTDTKGKAVTLKAGDNTEDFEAKGQ